MGYRDVPELDFWLVSGTKEICNHLRLKVEIKNVTLKLSKELGDQILWDSCPKCRYPATTGQCPSASVQVCNKPRATLYVRNIDRRRCSKPAGLNTFAAQ